MNDIHEFLGAYCTDALDPQECAAFEDHLTGCADCRAEAADFREVLGALSDEHRAHPPNSLEDAVLAGVRAGAPMRYHREPPRDQPRPRDYARSPSGLGPSTDPGASAVTGVRTQHGRLPGGREKLVHATKYSQHQVGFGQGEH